MGAHHANRSQSLQVCESVRKWIGRGSGWLFLLVNGRLRPPLISFHSTLLRVNFKLRMSGCGCPPTRARRRGDRLGDALLRQVIVEAFQRFAVLLQGKSVHGVGAFHLEAVHGAYVDHLLDDRFFFLRRGQ